MKISVPVLCLCLTAVIVGAAQSQLPDCEWCGMPDAPDSLSWATRIAPEGEPGEPLIVEGVVYREDGETPAADVMVYVYHTNSEGLYPRRGDEVGNGRRHGYLRGWMKTDADGRYRFETIRPAPYPSHNGEPAHIHYTIQAPGAQEYWLDGAWFSDDPLVTPDNQAALDRIGGFSNVMEVEKDASGVWRGRRDIRLESYD